MKAILAIVLALLLACGGAMAEGADAQQPSRLLGDFPQAGFALNYPDEFNQMQGMLLPSGGRELMQGSGIYYTELDYLGLSDEEAAALEKEGEEAVMKAYQENVAPLCAVLAIDQGRDLAALNEILGGGMDESNFVELARVDDVTFYSYKESFDVQLKPGFAEEYETLCGMMDDVLANASYYKPVDMYEGMSGSAISFQTTDMDGNAVDSAELFGAHEFTLVNIWASWCGPCVNELQALQALNDSLAEHDCAVVGLLYDGADEDARETARGILAEKGVSYTVILPPDDVDELFAVQAFPTSYIVDRSGVIVDKPIVGAYVDKYEPAIMKALGK